MYKNLNNQSQGTDNCAVQEITYGQIDNQYVVDLENKTDPDRLAQINGFFVFSYRDYTKGHLISKQNCRAVTSPKKGT